VYVDPYDVGDIAAGIERVLGDGGLAGRMIRDGYENASRFSWEASADKMNAIVDKLAE
jgi:glycosyltransferase involved in cell wall biosynthesis